MHLHSALRLKRRSSQNALSAPANAECLGLMRRRRCHFGWLQASFSFCIAFATPGVEQGQGIGASKGTAWASAYQVVNRTKTRARRLLVCVGSLDALCACLLGDLYSGTYAHHLVVRVIHISTKVRPTHRNPRTLIRHHDVPEDAALRISGETEPASVKLSSTRVRFIIIQRHTVCP